MTIKFPANNLRKMQVKTTGSSEAWLMLPVPLGPYLMVSQHKYELINRLDKSQWADIEPDRCVAKFDLHYGFLTYANIDGKCQCIGAYLDTSD